MPRASMKASSPQVFSMAAFTYCVVVTSDRALAVRVRELGASVEPSGGFRSKLERR